MIKISTTISSLIKAIILQMKFPFLTNFIRSISLSFKKDKFSVILSRTLGLRVKTSFLFKKAQL